VSLPPGPASRSVYLDVPFPRLSPDSRGKPARNSKSSRDSPSSCWTVTQTHAATSHRIMCGHARIAWIRNRAARLFRGLSAPALRRASPGGVERCGEVVREFVEHIDVAVEKLVELGRRVAAPVALAHSSCRNLSSTLLCSFRIPATPVALPVLDRLQHVGVMFPHQQSQPGPRIAQRESGTAGAIWRANATDGDHQHHHGHARAKSLEFQSALSLCAVPLFALIAPRRVVRKSIYR